MASLTAPVPALDAPPRAHVSRTSASRAASTSRATTTPTRRARARGLARRSTVAARAQTVVDALAAVDAWSVTAGERGGLSFIPPGVETQLFQIGLAPYLAYLWFLGRARATPPTSTFGARFLLLFVFATIPAGIVAKTQYGDILANVDVLHGSSESLLTVSNALFAYGFGAAASAEAETRDEDEREEATPAGAVLGILFATCVVSTLAVSAGASAIAGDGILASEPSNALSLPTWAVHVSSVTEWALAMKYVAGHAERTGNAKWKNLTLGMSPFLASGITACTFHAFYNPTSISALVPLQALLTLLGNTGCAVAAYTIVNDDSEREAQSMDAPVPLRGAPSIENGVAFALQLATWTTLASAAVKYGELASPASEFFDQPSYEKALGIIALPTVAWTYYALNASEDAPKITMVDVKAFGVAGTLSYVFVELAFWLIAGPIAFGWYKVAEGTWLDLSDPVDKAKLFGAGAVFINVVRLFVPLRLAAALALAPVVAKFLGDDDRDEV